MCDSPRDARGGEGAVETFEGGRAGAVAEARSGREIETAQIKKRKKGGAGMRGRGHGMQELPFGDGEDARSGADLGEGTGSWWGRLRRGG